MTGAELLNAWIAAEREHPTDPIRRFTLLGLASSLGVTRTTVNAWRRGAQKPTDEHARKLANLTKNAVPARSWRAQKNEAA
jgi:transcriptional regulator with XRE-family HTH domain